jgi:hypothetical protein
MPVSDIVWGEDGTSEGIANFGLCFSNLAVGSDVSYTIESIKFLKNEVVQPISTTEDSKLSSNFPTNLLVAGFRWKYPWVR